jgi:hypothetical protein
LTSPSKGSLPWGSRLFIFQIKDLEKLFPMRLGPNNLYSKVPLSPAKRPNGYRKGIEIKDLTVLLPALLRKPFDEEIMNLSDDLLSSLGEDPIDSNFIRAVQLSLKRVV